MKHSGAVRTEEDKKSLPEIPDDFEWVQDLSEKSDDAWI